MKVFGSLQKNIFTLGSVFLLAATLAVTEASYAGRGHAISARGNVKLSGEIPVSLGMKVIDFNNGIDFQSLGKTHAQKTVGQIYIDSNAEDGFRLTINSHQNGNLAKINDQSGILKVPYLLTLERRGGVLGAGTVGPISASEIDLSRGAHLDFVGSNARPTRQLAYDVNLSVAEKKLPPGIYKDTLVFQLSAL